MNRRRILYWVVRFAGWFIAAPLGVWAAIHSRWWVLVMLAIIAASVVWLDSRWAKRAP